MKYVFITGGVVSSIGKGITAAALGKLLHSRGYKTNLLKLDIYYNMEPSRLNPLLHGEIVHHGRRYGRRSGHRALRAHRGRDAHGREQLYDGQNP